MVLVTGLFHGLPLSSDVAADCLKSLCVSRQACVRLFACVFALSSPFTMGGIGIH